MHILERQPMADDYPDPACEYLLPDADWVFLSGTTIINKTFPRLAELSQQATTVLMGPSVPWLPQLHEFGIDYIAGITVTDASLLYQTLSEGGGVKIFENGASYRLAALTEATSLDWLKMQIAQSYVEKERLSQAMEHWYEQGKTTRFPQFQQLSEVTQRLSHMDSAYKRLWDRRQLADNQA